MGERVKGRYKEISVSTEKGKEGLDDIKNYLLALEGGRKERKI